MEYKDYYKILGVTRKATDKEIKAAYRKLARKHHPDVNQGDARSEARIKEINEAYEVLSDAGKRRRYDELGANWDRFRNVPPGGAPGGSGGRGPGVRVEGFSGDFSDFFRTFFGGGGAPFGGAGSPFGGGGFEEAFGPAPRAEVNVELSVEELVRGTSRTIALDAGTRIEVKIPPGSSETLRVRGPQGDVYLKLQMRPHPDFERHGDDLQATVRVSLSTAVLGGEAQVPTPDGPVGVKVPEFIASSGADGSVRPCRPRP